MLLSAVSVLVVAQSSSEIPEGLMNNPVQIKLDRQCTYNVSEERSRNHCSRGKAVSIIYF